MVVARQHGRAPPPAQGGLTVPPRTGPRPDVLARLAEGVPAPQPTRMASPRARLLGVCLCLVTAVTVVIAVAVAGAP